MEYLDGGVGRGGGDVEHVPGWGTDGNERTARKGERGGGRVGGRGENLIGRGEKEWISI